MPELLQASAQPGQFLSLPHVERLHVGCQGAFGMKNQLMDLLDGLYGDGADRTSGDAAPFWDALFQQTDHPLSSDLPDANLVAWHSEGLLGDQPGRTALDVGCGLGRNSRWLAAQGFTTSGVDIAPYALEQAAERSQGQAVSYLLRDFIRSAPSGDAFDLVYDSGCFHHLAPHRRISYMQALRATLAPGGLFGICTFAAGRMGTVSADADLLREMQQQRFHMAIVIDEHGGRSRTVADTAAATQYSYSHNAAFAISRFIHSPRGSCECVVAGPGLLRSCLSGHVRSPKNRSGRF